MKQLSPRVIKSGDFTCYKAVAPRGGPRGNGMSRVVWPTHPVAATWPPVVWPTHPVAAAALYFPGVPPWVRTVASLGAS